VSLLGEAGFPPASSYGASCASCAISKIYFIDRSIEILDARAAADPELAVLSAMAHGHHPDVDKAVEIAIVAMNASLGLDPDRSMLYFDLVYASLSEAARKSLQAMDPAKYEYQSEFARRYLSQGRAEGEARGRAEMLLKFVAQRFAPLSDEVTARVHAATLEELDRWAERIDSAKSLDELLK
jgi:hypothetical protein